MIKSLLALTIFLSTLAFPTLAFAAEGSLPFSPPTENTDGTPLTDLSHYVIYAALGTDELVEVAQEPDETATTTNFTFSLPGLVRGPNAVRFVMTAVDGDDNESVFSNEVEKVVDAAENTPNAPILISITLEIGIDCPPEFTCTVNP